jgi:hypothetical protein
MAALLHERFWEPHVTLKFWNAVDARSARMSVIRMLESLPLGSIKQTPARVAENAPVSDLLARAGRAVDGATSSRIRQQA